MGQEYSVQLSKIINEFNLEIIFASDDMETRVVTSSDVLRPGMQLASGFYQYFDNERISILGKMESAYLFEQSSPVRKHILEKLFEQNVPAIIITRGIEVMPEITHAAEKFNIPVLRTEHSTSPFLAALIAALNIHLAPRISKHGVLVEVYGEGVLILGESGVGKSETAIELVKRGHRLVADDAVELKRVSSKTLVGSAPDVIKHFIELRGIGIIDIQKIFGMGAVKDTEKIDFIIHLENWIEDKTYDRLGLDDEYTAILDVKIPSVTVPVKPGRNLAVIVEVAAMNSRQKRMGYNAASALNDRLMKGMS